MRIAGCRWRRLASLLPCSLQLVWVFLAAGCGADEGGLAARYPVRGTVTYNGQPLASGTINFYPVDPTQARPASGTIQDGSFVLTTQNQDDGAMPGSYKVGITAYQEDRSKIDSLQKKYGGFTQLDLAKVKKTLLTPAKYQDPDTSGLTAEVRAGSNSFTFELRD